MEHDLHWTITPTQVALIGTGAAITGTLLGARWSANANLKAVNLNAKSQQSHWRYEQRFVYYTELIDVVNKLLFTIDMQAGFTPAEIHGWTDTISRAATRARFLTSDPILTSDIENAERKAYQVIRAPTDRHFSTELISRVQYLEDQFTKTLTIDGLS